MCLSTVYKGEAKPQNLLMSNVQRIDCHDGQIVLTDLMDRQLAIEGELIMADLVGGIAVIRETA